MAAMFVRPLVGLTMRLLPQPSTGDVHDALSQDWGRFLAAVGLPWLPLPNRGEESAALAHMAGITGFIFTGGGFAGEEASRDATETHLLAYARANGLPVLGICRGFQAVHRLLGGELIQLPGHVATRHALHPTSGGGAFSLVRTVNSYHTIGITLAAPSLTPLAWSLDATGKRHVEAAVGTGFMGLMWHPEREAVPHMGDVTLVRRFLTDGSVPCNSV